MIWSCHRLCVAEKRPNEHDWKSEYVQMAISSGNIEVLKLLLADKEYEIKWQTAQVGHTPQAAQQQQNQHELWQGQRAGHHAQPQQQQERMQIRATVTAAVNLLR